MEEGGREEDGMQGRRWIRDRGLVDGEVRGGQWEGRKMGKAGARDKKGPLWKQKAV